MKQLSPIAKRIKELRARDKITQKELAEKIGLSKSAIVSYENSVREPNSKAMVLLENFFHVTGAYLRGESDTIELTPVYKWDDSEIMDAVKDTFPILLHRLINSFQNSSELEQKMLFDIMTELCHISGMYKDSPSFRMASFFLVQEHFTQTTRFIDFCSRFHASSEVELNRLENYKNSFINNFEESLLKFQDSLNN